MKAREVLKEANDKLDISIKDIGKVFKTTEKISGLLDTKVEITEKTDGTKLNIIRNDKPFDATNYQNNWIVSYKNNIIYPTEFTNVSDKDMKSNAIGTSQYKIVHDHLKRVHSNTKSIPPNTEFFIEFLMNKPTLTRDYTFKHGMVLLAYSPTTVMAKHGKIRTEPTSFNIENRDEFAKVLKMNVPKVVFSGTFKQLAKSNGSPEEQLEEIKQKLLGIESEFGGKTEGVVIELPDGSLYKFLQDDQHDKETRMQRKRKYMGDPEEETKYWGEVRQLVKPLIAKLPKTKVQNSLHKLSKFVYGLKEIPLQHPKKRDIQIKDDIFLTAKSILIKQLEGNNGALMVGRFSPPTKAHTQIIGDALNKFDSVTLNVVKSGKVNAENPFPIELQLKMWESVFPNLNIQTSRTGNIVTILNKAKDNINVLLTGTDRADGYRAQLKRMPDISVEEIKRTAEDISASKVRDALRTDNINVFKSLMHPKLYQFYDELKEYV